MKNELSEREIIKLRNKQILQEYKIMVIRLLLLIIAGTIIRYIINNLLKI